MKEVDISQQLQQAEQLAQAGNIDAAIDECLIIEKRTRQAEDLASNSRVLLSTIRMCFNAGRFDLINECIVAFSKKQGLIKQAISRLVHEAMTYIDQINDPGERFKFLNTLRIVTEGKIFLEIERARITGMIAKIKEDEGDIAEALNLLSSLQVETYESMNKKEKTEFLLEQMRLAIMNKDYSRVYLTSGNINQKVLQDEANVELKLRYYDIMILRAVHEKEYLEVCKCYLHIYNTKKILDDPNLWQEALKNSLVFVILARYNNEQHDLLHRIYQDSNLAKIPQYKFFAKCFVTSEIIRWPKIKELCSDVLTQNSYFAPSNTMSSYHWDILHKRVVEHSIRVISQAYECINMERLAQLLDLNVDEAEKTLSKLVVNKTIYARIDRPLGIVSFQAPKSADDVLNDWGNNISSVLNLIVRTNHLITKEEMVHNAVKMKQ